MSFLILIILFKSLLEEAAIINAYIYGLAVSIYFFCLIGLCQDIPLIIVSLIHSISIYD